MCGRGLAARRSSPACGVDFESRGRRADEQLAVMRELWAHQPDGCVLHGEFFDFENVMCYPKPVAAERLPIHIGGHSRAAARRAGRLGDGFQPLGVTGPRLASLIALMRDEASSAGRDPAALEVSLGHAVTKIDAERAAGLDRSGRRPAGAGHAADHRHRAGQRHAVGLCATAVA